MLAILDRFLEAIAPARKWGLLDRDIQKAERALALAFGAQRRDFLARFATLKGRFPVEATESRQLPDWRHRREWVWTEAEMTARLLLEAIKDADWEPLFDKTEAATLRAFEEPLSALVEASLAQGGIERIADLGLNLSFNLRHPLAVQYVKAHALEASKLIQGTTRDYIQRVVAHAVEEGWSYDRTARSITDRFSEFAQGQPQKHIRSRAHLIAVYEAGEAYEEGSAIVARDLAGAGLEMEKRWLVTGGNVCEICDGNAAADWIPVDQSFGSGHDRPQAHPACVLPDTLVWAWGLERAYRMAYSGPMIELLAAGGMRLTVSPNHPIATPNGWIAAGSLQEGDYVLSGSFGQWKAPSIHPNIKLHPTSIVEVFSAFLESGGMFPIIVPPAAEQFHGDGRFFDGQVNVVGADSLLRNNGYAALTKPMNEKAFALGYGGAISLNAPRLSFPPFNWDWLAPQSSMGGLRQHHALALAESTHADGIGFADTSGDYAGSEKTTAEARTAYTKLQRKLLFGFSGLVTAQHLMQVRRIWYSGHVYDLQSFASLYSANGLFVHNCRCTALYRRVRD